MTGAQAFNPSSGESRPHTILLLNVWYWSSQVSLGKTPRIVNNDDCVSQSVLRTGSSRERHVQARFTVLFRLMRTSWLAMSLVSSLILRTRWGVLSWIMLWILAPVRWHDLRALYVLGHLGRMLQFTAGIRRAPVRELLGRKGIYLGMFYAWYACHK